MQTYIAVKYWSGQASGQSNVQSSPVQSILSQLGLAKINSSPPRWTRLGCDICTNVARRLIRIEVIPRLKTS